MGESDRVDNKSPEQANKWIHDSELGAPSKVKDLFISQSVPDFLGSSITLPGTWDRNESPIVGPRTLITFSNKADSAQMCLYDRGRDLRADSAKAFTDLLAANPELKNPKSLSPDEIKMLADVMGSTMAGDNQYVNSYRPPDPRSPAFHLNSAELVSLNGKTVLEVQGNFFDNHGQAGKEYKGIFVPGGPTGVGVKEFFLQADSKTAFSKHEEDYANTLQSIKW